jgi:hypothetical protein
MGSGSEAVLYDIDGDPLAIENNTAIPPLTSVLIGGGSDGVNAQFIRVNSDGYQIMIGSGTPGSPNGGIITIQGDPSGTPVPISGNITASNASVSDNDQAIPLFSNLIGGSDGTNLRPLRVFDVDSGGGQQWVLGVGLRKSAGGGSVEFGTSSDPIRTDPTGTTTQPVSGTVTANQGGTWTVQPGNTANTTPWLTTISQGGNAATVTGSNALKVDGSAVTQPVSGTVTVTQATAANLRAQLASETSTGSSIPSTAVMVGGSDGSLLRAVFLDSSGRQIVVGAAANGAAVAGNPVLMAGSDGTNARSVRTANDGTVRVDPTGTTTQPVSGTVAATQSGTWTVQPGNTANTTPWLITISQGGNAATVTASNALKVDGSAVTQPVSSTQLPAALVGGRLDINLGTWLGSTAPTVGQKTMANSLPIAIASDQTAIPASQSGTWTVQQGTPPWSVVGPAADGAALSGNPVRVAGSDGTNTQDIITDTAGRLLVSGAAADGSPITGNPVLMAGQDGINTQSILTDTIGRQIVVGASPDGSAIAGNPVLMGGTDGANVQTVELRNAHPTSDVQGIIVRNIEAQSPTFYAVFDRISPATNKYMATLFNTSSTRKVVIQRMWVYNWQISTVSGVLLEQYLARITARTSGTSVSIYAEDTSDTLSAGISADTNSSAVTEAHIIRRFISQGDEAVTNLSQLAGAAAASGDNATLLEERKAGTKGFVLRQNQGITIRNVTNSAIGTCSYIIEFTDEVA